LAGLVADGEAPLQERALAADAVWAAEARRRGEDGDEVERIAIPDLNEFARSRRDQQAARVAVEDADPGDGAADADPAEHVDGRRARRPEEHDAAGVARRRGSDDVALAEGERADPVARCLAGQRRRRRVREAAVRVDLAVVAAGNDVVVVVVEDRQRERRGDSRHTFTQSAKATLRSSEPSAAASKSSRLYMPTATAAPAADSDVMAWCPPAAAPRLVFQTTPGLRACAP
jgi:hypothetical protein